MQGLYCKNIKFAIKDFYRVMYKKDMKFIPFDIKILTLDPNGFRVSHEEKRKRALEFYGRFCVCCGKTEDKGITLHADHIFPKSIFPEFEKSFANYQILCEHCNCSKCNTYSKDYRYFEYNLEKFSNETKIYLNKIKDDMLKITEYSYIKRNRMITDTSDYRPNEKDRRIR